ncbi:MAG: hypothetical protein ACRD5M_06295 [Candidatus Acidiferrales bacterium]
MKKIVLAAVATFVVLMATNYLIHQIWLMPDYNAIPLSHRSAYGIQHRFWAMIVGQIFFSVMFAYIYTRGAEKKPWVAQGIRYGILMACLTVAPTSLSEYVVYIIPYRLAIKWMVAGGIQMILAGLVVAAICKDGAAS